MSSSIVTYAIGRGKGVDVSVGDGSVSRKHAELVQGKDGSLFLTDCGSSNGTYVLVNGQWMPIRQEFVQAHDPILLGRFQTTAAELLVTARKQASHTPRLVQKDTASQLKPKDMMPEGQVRRNPETGEIESAE